MPSLKTAARNAILFTALASVFSVASPIALAAPPRKATKSLAKPPAKPATPTTSEAAPKPAARTTPVGLPQDASAHDAESAIEWWYYNALLTTSSGHPYAVMASFFRTGLPSQRKGHYLIYSLTDLKDGTHTAYSVIDKADITLFRLYLATIGMQHPDDMQTQQMLADLRDGIAPQPHRTLPGNAVVNTASPFSISMDANSLTQSSDDGLSWAATLAGGDDWTLDLSLTQTPGRAPMLVGGAGKTGLSRPDDMYYLSLTCMKASATLTSGGVVEKLTGTGWLDRQWGTSWVAQDNGWDWFGLHLSDGSDLIIYRIRSNKTGKILKTEATLLSKNGMQTVDEAPILTIGDTPPPAPAVKTPTAPPRLAPQVPTAFTPEKPLRPVVTVPVQTPTTPTTTTVAAPTVLPPGTLWKDPATEIVYPQIWAITLPKLGLSLVVRSRFPDQSMPVLGMGDAIWEGVVTVSGRVSTPGSGAAGTPITGEGYMELVGYKKSAAAPPVPSGH